MKTLFRNLILWLFPLMFTSCGDYVYYTDIEKPTDETFEDGSYGNWQITEDGDTIYMFYLGEFTDIQNFRGCAIDAININLKGKITYWIRPTESKSHIAILIIIPFKFYFSFPNKNTKTFEENEYIGPVIYSLGKEWSLTEPVVEAETLRKTAEPGWQPAASFCNVSLTPKAEVEAEALFQILRKGRIDKRDDGYFYEDGAKLSKEEFDKAVKFGILVRK